MVDPARESSKKPREVLSDEYNGKLVEEIPVKLIQSSAKITNLEVEENPRLILRVCFYINSYIYFTQSNFQELSGNLFNGKELIINAKGLIGGLRKKEDGIACFGLKEKNEKEEIINDYILNIQDSKENQKRPILFQIYYRRDCQKYFLQMLENDDSFFCFVSLKNPYVKPYKHSIWKTTALFQSLTITSNSL